MMMRRRALVTGALSGVGALILATGLAQAHDEVTIRVAPPPYYVQQPYLVQQPYVAPPQVVISPSPPVVVTVPQTQERVVVHEASPAPVYSSPPPVYYSVPSSSRVFVGPSSVYIYRQGDRD